MIKIAKLFSLVASLIFALTFSTSIVYADAPLCQPGDQSPYCTGYNDIITYAVVGSIILVVIIVSIIVLIKIKKKK